MMGNTDLGVMEGLEEYGAVQGGIVFREDLRASDGYQREVYNEWVAERSSHLPALGPLYTVSTHLPSSCRLVLLLPSGPI